jgi:hypothetical protein
MLLFYFYSWAPWERQHSRWRHASNCWRHANNCCRHGSKKTLSTVEDSRLVISSIHIFLLTTVSMVCRPLNPQGPAQLQQKQFKWLLDLAISNFLEYVVCRRPPLLATLAMWLWQVLHSPSHPPSPPPPYYDIIPRTWQGAWEGGWEAGRERGRRRGGRKAAGEAGRQQGRQGGSGEARRERGGKEGGGDSSPFSSHFLTFDCYHASSPLHPLVSILLFTIFLLPPLDNQHPLLPCRELRHKT